MLSVQIVWEAARINLWGDLCVFTKCSKISLIDSPKGRCLLSEKNYLVPKLPLIGIYMRNLDIQAPDMKPKRRLKCITWTSWANFVNVSYPKKVFLLRDSKECMIMQSVSSKLRGMKLIRVKIGNLLHLFLDSFQQISGYLRSTRRELQYRIVKVRI